MAPDAYLTGGYILGTVTLVGNNVVYLDDNHVTTYGTTLARDRIERAITDAIRSRPSP